MCLKTDKKICISIHTHIPILTQPYAYSVMSIMLYACPIWLEMLSVDDKEVTVFGVSSKRD